MRELAIAFAAGLAIGAVLAGVLTMAFWRGFFQGFVVELTAGLAQMVAAEREAASGRKR